MLLKFCEECAPSHCGSNNKSHHQAMNLVHGTVHLSCGRLKRNGLQYECKRELCIKNPDCHRGKIPTRRMANSNKICFCQLYKCDS